MEQPVVLQPEIQPKVNKIHRHYALSAGLMVISLSFFSLTMPKSASSLVLIAGFVMFGLFLYSLLKLVMLLSGLNIRLSLAYMRGILLIGTVLPVLLLMLQSIGQLTLRDILTLCSLFLIGLFYVGHITQVGRAA